MFVILVIVGDQVAVRVEVPEVLVNLVIAVVVLTIQRVRLVWRSLEVVVVSVLEQVPSVCIEIGVRYKRVRVEVVHLDPVWKAVVVRVPVMGVC